MLRVKKDKFKWAFTLISIILLAVVVISIGIRLNKNEKTVKVSTRMYAIGAIDNTGKIVESKQSIYLRDMQTVDGLVIETAENASVSYIVSYYDEDKAFVSATTAQTADLDTTGIPSTAKYFRVMITPAEVDGEKVTVTIWNMSKYSNQLKIEFNK